jgi:uncharacterized membrane protein YkvA (DUF1232 family)
VKRKQRALAKDPRRNRVFAAVLNRAQWFAKNPEALRELFQKAARKTKSIPRAPFADMWAYLQAMLRLIRAHYRGEYRDVKIANLVLIIGAIIYVLDPMDLIPDWIPGLGFLDDATILAFAVQRTRETLDEFTTWETTLLVRRR